MSCLQENRLVLLNNPNNVVQLMPWKGAVSRQSNQTKSKLGDSSLPLHMNVGWLAFVGTEDDQAIGAIYKDGWHDDSSLSTNSATRF
jgi:hypothetical protein